MIFTWHGLNERMTPNNLISSTLVMPGISHGCLPFCLTCKIVFDESCFYCQFVLCRPINLTLALWNNPWY